MDNSVKGKILLMDSFRDVDFGKRLKKAIRLSPWRTQRAFAEAVHIQETTISEYVRGQLPRGPEMVRLAQALPEQITWILTGVTTSTKKPRPGADVMRERCAELLEQMPEAVVEGLVYHLERTLHWAKTGDEGVEAWIREVRRSG